MAYPLVKKYSQNDWRWRRNRLANTYLTLGGHGCLITCLAMIARKNPGRINKFLTKSGAFNPGGMLVVRRACKILGLQYNGITREKQYWLAIAETAHYWQSGYPQHFFIWLGDGQIIDPIDGKQKANFYRVKKYIKVDNGKTL